MIDWNENAISAVKEFYRWANLKHRAGCSADTDKFFSELDVNRPTQKTVADAVEQPHFKATRENLEKIAKDAQGYFVEVGQEGEKWTHKDGVSECKIIFTHGELSWVQYKTGENYVVRNDCLKPIKPTISEDAVSKLRAYANWTAGQESGYVSELIEEFIATHEII